MRKKLLLVIPFILTVAISIGYLSNLEIPVDKKGKPTTYAKKVRSSNSPKANIETKKARDEYFRNLLVNPTTKKLPENFRENENQFSERFSASAKLKALSHPFIWTEIGPYDVAGRTRALALDVRNSKVVLAGGVSGGIWKSTDTGETWKLTSQPTELAGVTCIAQDTRDEHQDTWYCATGEKSGSAQDQGWTAMYYGSGVFKSTDNGETWTKLFDANNSYEWDSYFDYITRIVVSPVSGNLFIAANNMGILKINLETDDIVKPEDISTPLVKVNDYKYPDVTCDSQGNLLAFLSEDAKGGASGDRVEPGVYHSTDDGENWTRITTKEGDLPARYSRGVIKFAPSNEDIAYAYIQNLETGKANLARITISEDKIENLSAKIPEFTDRQRLGLQGTYNMTMAIKPNDENFLILGSTLLFRIRNINAETNTDLRDVLIGGYGFADGHFLYPNHHPDCHITIFDPQDENSETVWSGHDGGLSYTTNISKATTAVDEHFWVTKNNGYNITQFYTVSLDNNPNINQFMGGTQDNGSPSFKLDATGKGEVSEDISSGDGAYCHMGSYSVFTSSQNANIYMRNYSIGWVNTTPPDLDRDQALFIHPFVVEPNEDKQIYVPFTNNIFLNTDVSVLPQNIDPTTTNWEEILTEVPAGNEITTLAISSVPANVLYFATYGGYSVPGKPVVYKITNAHSSDRVITTLNLTDVVPGAYPHNISINPHNADELIVSFSNYGINSLHYSNDGGATFIAIDGNLDNENKEGPSIRTSAILPYSDKTYYLAGTSIGLFITDNINGATTAWEMVSPNDLGNVVVNALDVNERNGEIAIGTHGRGIFRGFINDGIYVNKKLNNHRYRKNEKTSLEIDLTDYFKGQENIELSIAGNSNADLFTPQISGTDLTVTIAADKTGKGIITINAAAGDKAINGAFAIEIFEDVSTDIRIERIENSSEERTEIYPNPSNGVFHITEGDDKVNKITVYDLSGKLITERFNQNSIDITSSPKGVYVLVIEFENNTIRKKVMKQ